MRVTIAHVRLEADAPILNNDAIQMLFVEYRFLGVPLEETETPFSLPKPKPDTQIAFNFTKGGYNTNDFKMKNIPILPEAFLTFASKSFSVPPMHPLDPVLKSELSKFLTTRKRTDKP